MLALTAYSPDPNDPNQPTNGQVVERYTYTPYGTFTVLKGAASGNNEADARLTSIVGNVFAHQGLPFDAETGSYQNRWRERDPVLSNYLQRDSVVQGPDFHCSYRALNSSPLRLLDPTGAAYTCRVNCDRTCDDCATYCADDPPPNGVTTCEGGQPCCCVCEDNISNAYGPDGANLDTRIIDAIRKCAEVHEGEHFRQFIRDRSCRPGSPPPPDPQGDECTAYERTVFCLFRDGGVATCATEPDCRAQLGPYLYSAECACRDSDQCGDISQCRTMFNNIRAGLGLTRGPVPAEPDDMQCQ